MTKERKKLKQIKSEHIIFLYSLICKEGSIKFGIPQTTVGVLESILSTVNDTFFGVERYNNKKLKAVALLYFLIKDHPFIDGNKRLAIFVFEVFCEINELVYKYPSQDLDAMAIFIEQEKTKDHYEFITRLVHIIF